MTKRLYPTVNFRVSDTLLRELNVRVQGPDETRHAVAKRDLERYYELLSKELRTVSLSRNEVAVLLELPQGHGLFWKPLTAPPLHEVVNDALRYDGGAAQDVQKTGLIRKLKKFNPAQNYAVVDALERLRVLPASEQTDTALVEAGLIRTLDEHPRTEWTLHEEAKPGNVDHRWLFVVPPPSGAAVAAASRNEPALRAYFGMLHAKQQLQKANGFHTPWYDEQEMEAILTLSGDALAARAYWAFFRMVAAVMATGNEALTRRTLLLDQIDSGIWEWMAASALAGVQERAGQTQDVN